MIRLLACVLLLSFPVCAAQVTPEPSTREEFMRYFESFQEAVKDNDVEAILPLAQFPFVTRGRSDMDPEILHTPEQFRLLWEGLLAADVPQMELPTPMRELIVSFDQWNDQEILAGHVRIGNFEFKKNQGSWRWVFAYLDPVTP